MERIEADGKKRDKLRVTLDEVDKLDGAIEPDWQGHFKEAFSSITIELPNGRELTFTGYGGTHEPVTLTVDGPGRNKKSCIDCEEYHSEWSLNPIKKEDGPTLYICDDCKTDNPITDLLG
jgi:hypothetical protein